MRSYDWGYSWTEPEDMAVKSPLFQGWPYGFGPGYGIIKQHKPNIGRIFGCGHSVDRNHLASQAMYCLYSDDGGDTWTIGATLYSIPYGVPKKGGDFMPGETQPLELPDGSILVNTRNSEAFHCRCRIIAQSYDGGASFSFSNVTINEELVDPGCEGSTIIHNNIVYFSNPNTHSGRLNMTVKYSTDFGKHWDVAVNVYSGSSEYSCLSPIDDNNIGVLYERDGYHKMGFAKIRLN
ncbi:sialidase-1-like [Glandiceps talaboti]